MSLSPEQLKRIGYLVRDKWVGENELESYTKFHQALSEVTAPEELHQFAANFNRDCGHDALFSVLRHPLCDKGTALLIYFYATPAYFYRHRQQGIPFRVDEVKTFMFLLAIERLVEMGWFKSNLIKVDPANIHGRNHLEKNGANLIPAFMKQPSEGIEVEILRF